MSNLPCKECGGACCKTNQFWDECQFPAGQTPPALLKFENGACPLLTKDGKCSVWGTPEQKICRDWSCVTSPLRFAIPELGALLKSRGL